jgi:hypothetical protein
MGSARRLFYLQCVTLLIVLPYPCADPDAVTDGYAQVTGLTFIPENSTDSIQWSDDWFFFLSTDASSDLAIPDSDFDIQSDLGLNSLSADAATPPYAASHAEGSFDGTSLFLEASGQTQILDPLRGFADANASAYFDGFFVLTGGVGSASVDFALTYMLLISGLATNLGYFDQTAFVSLGIYDGFGETELFYDFALESVSFVMNDALNETYSGSLMGSLLLDYDTPYYIVVTADNEHHSVNEVVPVPNSIILVSIGAVILAGLRRRTRSLPRRI